jgi:hypothetical protein
MTEQEWLTSTDPAAMLEWVQKGMLSWPTSRVPGSLGRVSDRKLRLFACACKLASGTNVAHTAYAEMLANDGGPPTRLSEFDDPKRLAEIWCDHDGLEALMLSRHRPSRHPTKAARADLLRHIVGNPFRKYAWTSTHDCAPSGHELQFLDERWRTPTVVSLAQAIYDGDQSAADPLHDALLECGLSELAEHFDQRTQECIRCGGAGEYDDVGHEDLDGLGGIAAIVHCERCVGGRVSMVQEYNDGGTSYWFNLLEPNTRHLTPERAQPKHPKGCWVLDLILGKE